MENAEKNDLIDYKKLTHEELLDQIMKLFSLDTPDDYGKKMTKDELKKMCEELDNYIFVSDNFIKMVRMLLNIEANIPFIMMSETGVGKTKLLEMLYKLYGRDNKEWYKLQIHAGITDTDIVDFQA